MNDQDSGEHTPLLTFLCAGRKNKNIQILRYLITKGAHPRKSTSKGFTPIHVVAQHGNPELINCLIEYGVDVNVQEYAGWSPLHLAAAYGRVQNLRTLIEHGAQINVRITTNQTPLHIAAQFQHIEIFKALLKHGAEVGPYGRLLAEAGSNDIDTITALLEQIDNINMRDECGMTLLHAAVDRDIPKTVDFLLSQGADVSGGDFEKETLVELAIRKAKG